MGTTGKRQRRLSDGYSFVGFRARATIRGEFGDPDVRIVTLDRRSKKPSAAAVGGRGQGGTIRRPDGFTTFRAAGSVSSWSFPYAACRVAVAVQ